MNCRARRKILDETTGNLIMAIGLASIFVYMVLAAQFESFVQPIVIMLVLPLSVPFALFTLWATGRTLNLWSALGILLLLGIVKKNSILQVDYANMLRPQGMPLERGDRRGVPHPAAADSDDDRGDHRRPDPDRARLGIGGAAARRSRSRLSAASRCACSSRCCWCRSRTSSWTRSSIRRWAANSRDWRNDVACRTGAARGLRAGVGVSPGSLPEHAGRVASLWLPRYVHGSLTIFKRGLSPSLPASVARSAQNR